MPPRWMNGLRVLLIATLLAALWAPLRSSQAGAPSGEYVLVDADDLAAQGWAVAAGGQVLVDYGAFALWRLAEPPAQGLLAAPNGLRAAGGKLYLRGYTLDTTQAAVEPGLPAGLRAVPSSGAGLWMVQFIGPALDDWLDALRAAGLEIVAYLPDNAYLVWGDDPPARIAGLAALDGLVQWQGAYQPAYRLAPALHELALGETSGTGSVEVTVQVYDSPRLAETLARLAEMAEAQLAAPQAVLNLTNLRLRLPAARLAEAAALADVYNIEPYQAPVMQDEIQGQVVAGNISSTAGQTTASGPGYLDWLASKGFPTDPAAYPLVDVIDDGIDAGDAADVQHPDFYELGDPTGADRIVYIANCTADASGNGAGGHGNLNAGILGGYNDRSGFPYEDTAGFQYGLGISPYGSLAGTKIFANAGQFDLSQCSGSDTVMIHKAYQNGARLTSDSWGSPEAGVYTADAQLYDLLTRDASSAAGNQEMLHVFAGGNYGPGAGSIDAPAVAKNVLAVGATENPRDNGVSCNGFTNADSADDIASYSSRGPAADGRAKPDLVAPGTHVQGPATQDPEYNYHYVCTDYYPAGQTLYTWSTGTSHATPAVAGAAQLAYEYYGRVLAPGQTPSPAMLKALLLNSPRYLESASAGGTLPASAQGWGMLDLGRLFDDATRTLYDQISLLGSPGEGFQVSGTVIDPALPLRISLVWSDAPGGTTGGQALVNDLDLEVTIGGTVYYGNVFSGAESTTGGTADSLNNVENVFLPAGTTGDFEVHVVARNLGGDGVPGNSDLTDQDFALVVYNGASELAPSLSVKAMRWSPLQANLNAYPEPGETLELEIDLANAAVAAPATGISAELALVSGQASVVQGESNYADLPPGALGANQTRFRVAIDPAQPCGGNLNLELHVSYQGGQATLTLPEVSTALPQHRFLSYSYSGPPVDIPDNELPGVALPISVDEPALLLGMTVTLNIQHPFVSDLVLSLTGPQNDTILLAQNRGGSTSDYTQVTFDDQATRSIVTATAPFSGSYRPEEPLGTFVGRSAAGAWTLQVADIYGNDVGTIDALSLTTEFAVCTAGQYFFPNVSRPAEP